jgi:hypothetical protein
MNVEIGTETPIFLFWEYLLPIFGIFSLECVVLHVWGNRLVLNVGIDGTQSSCMFKGTDYKVVNWRPADRQAQRRRY